MAEFVRKEVDRIHGETPSAETRVRPSAPVLPLKGNRFGSEEFQRAVHGLQLPLVEIPEPVASGK